MSTMRLIDVCWASYVPRFASYIAARPTGWAVGLTLLLLTAQSPTAQVTLAWDDSPSAEVAGYLLYYGIQSRTYTASIDVGMATTYTITGLPSGQTYYFAVTAYDSTGDAESDFSDEIFTTLHEEPIPEEFIMLEAEAMALTDYRVEKHTDASGGAVISRLDVVRLIPGMATAAFPGPAGSYEIIVSYFDASDGQSTLAVAVNDEVIDTWLANAGLPDGAPNAVTLMYRVVATGLPLTPGDRIVLEGHDQGSACVRLDKVEFVPISHSLEVIVDN